MDPQHPSSPPPSYQSPSSPGGGSSFANLDPRVRNLAIGLFVLALLVLIGTFTSSWVSRSEGPVTMGAGLTGVSVEVPGKSRSESWSDSKAPGDFTALGYLGILGALASVAGAVAMGVFAMTNKPNKIPPKIFQIVLGVTVAVMLVFLIRVMTHKELKELSISYSGILAMGGVIGIGVVSKMLYGLRPYQA